MQRLAAFLLCLGALAAPGAHAADARREITVFAAASLTEVIGDLAARYATATGVTVKPSLAASSALARQVEAGAMVDVFISADEEWMDYLDQRGLIEHGTRIDLLGNRLVLIAPADRTVAVTLAPGVDLAVALGPGGRLALADPDVVPAGRYARAALGKLGAWEPLAGRLVPAENVRAAMAFVARGEAVLGIVYATDARVERRVQVVATLPEDSHPPIRYPAAAVRGARAGAADFLRFLRSPAAASVFSAAGFIVPPAG